MTKRYILGERTITNIFQRTEQRHVSGSGKEAVMATEKLGWYVTLDHRFSYYIGEEQPLLEIGQEITVVLETVGVDVTKEGVSHA